MARRQSYRGKPKKRLNRYDPNRPDWAAVHAPYFGLSSLFRPGPFASRRALAPARIVPS